MTLPRSVLRMASDEDDQRVPLKEQLRLFRRLAVPYFEQAEGAKLQFALLLLLVLIDAGVSVVFSYVGRDFYSALSAKDQALFIEKTANFAVVALLPLPPTLTSPPPLPLPLPPGR